MDQPLVSVVIPAYNASRFIREAVESALHQTHRDVEVIVVDDGSADRVDWIVQLDPQRVMYLWKPNGGPGSARNAGVRLARGEHIAFLDADDAWEPDKLARQLAALARRPEASLVYGAVRQIDESGRLLEETPRAILRPSGRIAEALFERNVIPTSTVLARRECLERAGLFDESPDLISVEDYDLWLRVAEREECIGLNEPLARYRLHSGGIGKRTARSYDGEQRVIERALERAGSLRPTPNRLRKRLARLRFACGHEYWTAGALREARAQFAASLAHQPRQPGAWGYYLMAWFGQPGVALARAAKRLIRPAPPPSAGTGQQTLRVLHILNTLETGGAEHVALNLAQRMDPAHYALHVCSLSGEGSLADAFRRIGVTVHALRRKPGVDPGLCLALARLIRRERITIVHTHNAGPWLYGGLAAKLAGARLCHTEHSNLFPHQRMMLVVERWLAGVTDVLISDSEKVTRYLSERQGIPVRRITTIPNGIDAERFARSTDRRQTRRALGIGADEPVVGTVGRLAAVKDQGTLLEAFALVSAAYPEAWLLLIGEGALRPVLETQARRLGIGRRTLFLGDRRDVPELLGAMDLFVLSSISEGLPLTILEAMAAGLPVVSTRVGGIPEAVVDRQTGWLVPPKDPREMAEVLIWLLADEGERRRLGAKGRARVQERFDLGRMADAYARAYRY